MSIKNKIYSKMPVALQNGLISLYGLYWYKRRFGGVFKHELKGFEDRELWSSDEWDSFQTDQLRMLLVHAFDFVPFYRRIYSEVGLKREDLMVWRLENLNQLPFLEKEDLRKFGDNQLMARNHAAGDYYSSSGSTGTPTKIFYSPGFHQIWSAAFEARVRKWAGVDYKTPRGMIGGRRVVVEGDSKGPFYRYNHFEKQTYFSAYHIGPESVENYLKGMIDGQVEYMTGYAMSNYFLAQEIEKAGLQAPKLKAVITSSEKLSSEMRATFKRVYGCPTFDSYSGVEACNLISETPDGYLVNSPDVGILELVDENGREVNPGESGEVISTGLLNFDQPLIRYRIGDRISKLDSMPENSIIQMPFLAQIDGRIEDKVIGPDGRVMVRFHGIFIDITGLIASQVVQESEAWINLNLVVDDSFQKMESEQTMIKRLRSQLGPELKVTFKYLNELPRTSAGKVKAVISKIQK